MTRGHQLTQQHDSGDLTIMIPQLDTYLESNRNRRFPPTRGKHIQCEYSLTIRRVSTDTKCNDDNELTQTPTIK